MPSRYQELLAEGFVVVTPSRRIAGLIADRYNSTMVAAGSNTWEAPAVMPLGAWIGEAFERLAMAASAHARGNILLSPEQERAIWEQVVRERDEIEPEQIDAFATLAMNAWSTATLWALPLAAVASSPGRQEVRAFVRWARRFEQRCDDLAAIDQYRFAERLAALEASFADILPPFKFYGFPRLPPLLARIERRLSATTPVPTSFGQASGITFECQAFANSEVEIRAAMIWAGARKRCQPQASVMVALTGVSRVDAILEQRLLRGFRAGNDGEPVSVKQLDCPSGVSLADTALVQSALLILDRRRVRRWDETSRLLLSPYLGEAESERGARALLDDRLRRRGDVDVALNSVIDAARQGGATCPALIARLDAMVTTQESTPPRQSMHAWMLYAQSCLDAAGWPGDRELNGAEQSVMSEWHRVMDAAAQLDAVAPTCSWHTAFGRWRAILRRRQLVRLADVNAVQVVTLDEAVCVGADALWVTGFHDGAWPPPLEVSPLLPFALQREYGIPGSHPARDLEDAETRLRLLAHRHPQARWSFAQMEGATPRRPRTGIVCTPVASPRTRVWPRGDAGGGFDSIDDTYTTALEGAVTIGGGAALFRDQAACPFRALARHRLGARAPEDASPGLSALQRGILVHAVMAAVWGRVRSSANLAAAGEERKREIVAACVAAVIDQYRGRYRQLDAFWELEHARLIDLSLEWLGEESRRGEFEVVACEQSRPARIGGYTVNTRIDRIDRLANGDLIIIDYKTGTVSRSNWSVPRPDDPQLPLYAVSADAEQISGIAYAGLKKGACKIVDEPQGIMIDAQVADSADWNERRQAWDSALKTLTQEIGSGYAPADPKNGVSTCRRCDLQCLCRVSGSRAAGTVTDDEI